MKVEIELPLGDPRTSSAPAFGESLGIDVPTRYNAQIHANVNMLTAADSLVTPVLLGMSGSTVWVCRAIAGLLFLTRAEHRDLSLRHRLEIEAASGILLIIAALRGSVTRRWFENAYLFIGGVIMVANSLMTQIEPE